MSVSLVGTGPAPVGEAHSPDILSCTPCICYTAVLGRREVDGQVSVLAALWKCALVKMHRYRRNGERTHHVHEEGAKTENQSRPAQKLVSVREHVRPKRCEYCRSWSVNVSWLRRQCDQALTDSLAGPIKFCSARAVVHQPKTRQLDGDPVSAVMGHKVNNHLCMQNMCVSRRICT